MISAPSLLSQFVLYQRSFPYRLAGRGGVRDCRRAGAAEPFIPPERKHGRSPAKRLEHVSAPVVAYLILPVFRAFGNAGVSLFRAPIGRLRTSMLLQGELLPAR